MAASAHRVVRNLVLAVFLAGCTSTGSTSVGELNYAIMNDDLAAVRAGIENGANVNGTNNELKATPLHTAALRGNVAMVKALVEAGAEVDIADCMGQTPLMYSARGGSVAVSRYLMENGARANRLTGDSAISCKDATPDGSPLSTAARFNHPDVVRLLLEKGARTGGDRALAWALSDPSRDGIASQLKEAGYRANDDTVRMAAQLAALDASQKQGASQQTAQARNGDPASDVAGAAVDAVALGVLWNVLGGF